MAKERLKRKLTAILSAVAEGYSRLMGNDESNTINTLTAYKEALAAYIKHNRGWPRVRCGGRFSRSSGSPAC